MDLAAHYARQIDALFRAKEGLTGIPQVTEAWAQRMTAEGRQLFDREARRIERRLDDESRELGK